MATIIVFEGPDRAGKSTLARTMAAAYQTDVTHFGMPDAEQKAMHPQYQYLSLLRKPSSPEETLVLDRSWISGLFYDVVRRKQRPEWYSVDTLESQLVSLDWRVVYIFVHRPWTPELLQSHLLEINQGEGYGTLAERMYEHFAWNTFVKSFQPNALLFPLVVLENPTLDQAYENLATGNLPSARLYDVCEPAYSAAKHGSMLDVWAEQPWANSIYQRNSSQTES